MNIQYFKNVQLEQAIKFDSVVKKGKLYQAPLLEPLVVQTPVVALSSISSTHATLSLQKDSPLHAFFTLAETIAKKICSTSSSVLGLSSEQVESSFKTFLNNKDGLKVRLAKDFHMYSHDNELIAEPTAADQCRAVLRLEQVSLGKTEIGILWHLVQVKTVEPTPECLIDVDIEIPDDVSSGSQEEEEGADFV